MSINSNGEISVPTKIVYVSDKKDAKLYNETGAMWKYGWEIKSQTFKNKYQDHLYWGPASGIFQPNRENGKF